MDIKTYLDERGRAKKLATDIGVSPSYLSQMISAPESISPKRCVEIENATSGEVTRKDLRPDWRDIWPELASQHQ